MATLTFNATSPYRGSGDPGDPSTLNVTITDSSDPQLPNGVYDAWCLDPNVGIDLGRDYAGAHYDGSTLDAYIPIELAKVTEAQLGKLHWILAQNLTAPVTPGDTYNYGEVQSAIWKLLGHTIPTGHPELDNFLSNNGRQPVDDAKVSAILTLADEACATGAIDAAADQYFTRVIDPDGKAQPLILQQRTAQLGDFVWEDANHDGVQGANESGIDNVTVNLLDASGTIIKTVVTGDDPGTAGIQHGFYRFTGLRPGTYTVEFVKPGEFASFSAVDVADDSLDAIDSDAGNTGRSDSVTLKAGEINRTIDAGLVQRARLGDRIWEDTDADGRQDAGEQGIANVEVHLRNAAGNIIASTTTDVNGLYGFNVLPGTYSVHIEKPAGYVVSPRDNGADDLDSDIDAAAFNTHQVTLLSGQSDSTLDAGLYRSAEIGDRVWLDRNGNGLQDNGETGMANVAVHLRNANGAVIATQRTDALGNYLFTDLRPGTYSLKFDAPEGYVFTLRNKGDDTADSDASRNNGQTINTVLTSGESDRTWDAGLFQRARLGDRVWEDTDADGIQDEGEAGIGNVTVHLRNADGEIINSTVTNSQGFYSFQVRPGTYSVSVVPPTGYLLTRKNAGSDDALDSDIDPATRASAPVTLQSGDENLTLDAGLYRKASIGDRVWEDRDHDYNQDSAEPGVGNVKVSLQNSAGVTLKNTFTDRNGYYLFADLDPGVYRIAFDKSATVYRGVDMSTWRWAKADIGGNDNIDADAFSTGDVAITAYTTLESGENDRSWEAGITPIIVDLNGNGVRTIARADSDATFDLIGNGAAIRSGWVSAEDGLLAVDNNGNGSIDSLHELFGGLNKGDGFARLQSYDSNGDGWVDASDARFDEMRIWQDADSDRVTDGGELRTLAEAGIAALKAGFVEKPFVDAQGNLHLEQSSAQLSDGTTVDMTDVYFNVSSVDAAQAGVELQDLAALIGDDRMLDGLLGDSGAHSLSSSGSIAQSAINIYDSSAEVSRSLISQLEHNAEAA